MRTTRFLTLTWLLSTLLLSACAEGALEHADLGWDAGEPREEGFALDAPEELADVAEPDDPSLDPNDVPEDYRHVLEHEHIPKAVVGTDSRARVADTRAPPYSAIAQVLTQWRKGAAAIPCTGTMIASDAVLTAAHCVYDSLRTPTGFPYSVAVVPGLYPRTPAPPSGARYHAPFGVGYAKKLFLPDRFRTNDDDPWGRIPFDYAVIRLKKPLAGTGSRRVGVHDVPLAKRTVLLGYHDDKQAGMQLYESRDLVRQVLSNGTLNHYTDLRPGASGAGLTDTGAFSNTVFAIQSSHVDAGHRYNIAALITPDKLRSITSWATRPLP